ncbi:hypothetical protein ACFE04_011376 [Oxalis oulophora]
MEVSIMLHLAIVMILLRLLSYFDQCHSSIYIFSFIYLYLVLTDSETVHWLNHAVEKIWPICVEQIVSQKILLPIIPWFLEKYKPWTAQTLFFKLPVTVRRFSSDSLYILKVCKRKEAEIRHLYMGRHPPIFTEMRVLQESAGDDHLVLELGMNFLAADDMNAVLDIKLRKRLGFGMWAKMHITGMHIEGKVLVGVKFLRNWPFLGRIRVCFVEPPYFQMTVKPIFTHGVDVTVIPGIAGWLDKLLSTAFLETLVEPNMLVVDMEKFASPEEESWFHVDEMKAIAFAKVEVVEASDIKPSDMNGLADPYVKGHLGSYRFRTQVHRKTLAPKWLEEFKIPISTWEPPNLLFVEVFDKDHFIDDTLGHCTININDLRGGQRHDMWLPLENIKMGRLHLAITVLEDQPDSEQTDDKTCESNDVDKQSSSSDESTRKPSLSPERSIKVSEKFEPINIEGQHATGIWVHRPGSEASPIWESRKGKSRRIDSEIHNEIGSNDESHEGKHGIHSFFRGIRKITAVFHKKEEPFSNLEDNSVVRSPYANIKAVNDIKDAGLKFAMEKGNSTAEESNSGGQSSRAHMKDMAKTSFEEVEKGDHSIKHALSRKHSRRCTAEKDICENSESSDEESSLLSPNLQGLEEDEIGIVSSIHSSGMVVSPNPEEDIAVEKE